MVSNKKAKQTLALPCWWDEWKPVNKKVRNKVVVSLWASAIPWTIRHGQVKIK